MNLRKPTPTLSLLTGVLLSMSNCKSTSPTPDAATDPHHAHDEAPAHARDHQHGHATPHHEHEHGHGMPHDFSDAERWATVFDDPERDAWQLPSDLVALAELRPGMTVAEIGAGTGYFLPHLSRAVGETGKVLALDIQPTLVEHMRERAQRDGLANVDARVVAPDDPALPAQAVDRVLVVNVWHHLDDRVAYARHLERALAPGGRVVIVDFTTDSPHGPPPEHRLAPESIADDLARAGLNAHLPAEPLPYQYVVFGERVATRDPSAPR